MFKLKTVIIAFVVCLIVPLVVVSVGVFPILEKQDQLSYLSGKNAYLSDVPPSANPYQGTDHRKASLWLNGWMDEKEKMKSLLK